LRFRQAGWDPCRDPLSLARVGGWASSTRGRPGGVVERTKTPPLRWLWRLYLPLGVTAILVGVVGGIAAAIGRNAALGVNSFIVLGVGAADLLAGTMLRRAKSGR
jgi:hypothetical protein